MTSLNVILTVATMVFSIGVTWGVMTARTKSSDGKANELVEELKRVVGKLETLVTDIQIIKVVSARHDKDVEDLDKRVSALEIANAKRRR